MFEGRRMTTCAQCGAEVVLPYHCKYCGGYFCPEHRLPENHGCPKLPRGSLGTKLGVEASKQAIRKVRLRSGRIVDFDKDRITNDIFRRTKNLDVARELSDRVVRILNQRYAGRVPTTKEIQHIVKRVLIEHQKWPKSRIRSGLRNFTRVLKKKRTIVLLAILVVVSIWAWVLLSAPSVQLQAYQQFLSWALLVFGFAFMISFIATIPQKKRPSVRIRGEIEVEEGAEVIIRTPKPRHWRVSRKVAKWVLVLGGIFALFGFAYGVASYEFGFTSVALGGIFLGVGLGLYIFRSSRYS